MRETRGDFYILKPTLAISWWLINIPSPCRGVIILERKWENLFPFLVLPSWSDESLNPTLTFGIPSTHTHGIFSSHKSRKSKSARCSKSAMGIARGVRGGAPRPLVFFPCTPLTLLPWPWHSWIPPIIPPARHESKHREHDRTSRFLTPTSPSPGEFSSFSLGRRKKKQGPACRSALTSPGKNAYWKPGDAQWRADLKVDSKLNRRRGTMLCFDTRTGPTRDARASRGTRTTSVSFCTLGVERKKRHYAPNVPPLFSRPKTLAPAVDFLATFNR